MERTEERERGGERKREKRDIERERERETERERQTDREAETEREAERGRGRKREREREGGRNREENSVLLFVSCGADSKSFGAVFCRTGRAAGWRARRMSKGSGAQVGLPRGLARVASCERRGVQFGGVELRPPPSCPRQNPCSRWPPASWNWAATRPEQAGGGWTARAHAAPRPIPRSRGNTWTGHIILPPC